MDDVKTPAADTAALIDDDEGQTVRLPDEYRFDGTEVSIRREGRKVVLEPVETEPTEKLAAWIKSVRDSGAFDEDFVEAALDRPKDFGAGRRDDDINLD